MSEIITEGKVRMIYQDAIRDCWVIRIGEEDFELGREKPNLAPGDRVKITIQKEEANGRT